MSEPDEPQSSGCRPPIIAIIPAYNEERFIGSVVLKAREYADVVIVVDDGSTDRTASVSEMAGARVMRHEVNQGKGRALDTGFCAARTLHPEAIVMLDGDGQHLPEEVPSVVAPILAGDADLVIGSRYLSELHCIPRYRTWGHRAANLLTDLASGVQATDSQSGFRAFSPRAVKAISFSSSGFSVESEMQFLARDLGLRIVEVPITADYMDPPKRSVINHGLSVFPGLLQLAVRYRPLVFLGAPGLLVLLFGLGWCVRAVHICRRSQTPAIGSALFGPVLAVVGSLSLFTGITLHSVRGILHDTLRNGEHTRDESAETSLAQR